MQKALASICQERKKWEAELASAKENEAKAEARMTALAKEKDHACRRCKETEKKLTAAEVCSTVLPRCIPFYVLALGFHN